MTEAKTAQATTTQAPLRGGRHPNRGLRQYRLEIAAGICRAAPPDLITQARLIASCPPCHSDPKAERMRQARAAWVIAIHERLHPHGAMRRVIRERGEGAGLTSREARARTEKWCIRVKAWGLFAFLRYDPRSAHAKRLRLDPSAPPPLPYRPCHMRGGHSPDTDVISMGGGRWMIYDTSELGDFDPHTCHLPPGGHPCE